MNEEKNNPIYGPQVQRPLRIRLLRYASLILATAGLGLLYIYSIQRDIPIVRIAEITPSMNFATVKLSGKILRNAYLFESGGVVFNLADATGEIEILGGREQANALKTAKKLPQRGDQIDVVGTLRLHADQTMKMRMQSARQLVIKRKSRPSKKDFPCRIPISDVTIAQADKSVTVIGILQSIEIPKPGSKAPYVLMLAEGDVELPVVFWDPVFQGLERKLPVPGKRICVHGRVKIYKGELELILENANDFRVEKVN